MVLCYRRTVILRPTSKHYSANATMSCVGLGRSSLYDIFTRFGLADYSALESSSTVFEYARLEFVCNIICFLLHCVMFLFVALHVSFYHVSLKAPQLCLLISLTLTRRFMCLCPGSSVTGFPCGRGIVGAYLSQFEWCKAPSSCISMS
jgi:hypothetical protein